MKENKQQKLENYTKPSKIILQPYETCPFSKSCNESHMHSELMRCTGTRQDRKTTFVCELNKL